jgi:hypothetical protein
MHQERVAPIAHRFDEEAPIKSIQHARASMA